MNMSVHAVLDRLEVSTEDSDSPGTGIAEVNRLEATKALSAPTLAVVLGYW